jgi:hypothetical protein
MYAFVRHLEIGVSVGLAAAIATIFIAALSGCAPAVPPRPAKSSVHVRTPAPILTADAKEWCDSFGYRQGSHAYHSCLARWAKAEKFETQRLRFEAEAGAR